ncbi:hypothetical protein [Paenibacillus sp. YYML68]|uniref:hypothetical protein n=1 Tax=Paenibacillus sp. YYML68 TaxID=2909250 RepID=UPI002490C1EC|nr:hypothetical protein [Paenibacillus sp. YYML68]
MRIFEWLLDNWVFFAVLLFSLSSMLGKKKSADPKRPASQPRGGMPTFGGGELQPSESSPSAEPRKQAAGGGRAAMSQGEPRPARLDRSRDERSATAARAPISGEGSGRGAGYGSIGRGGSAQGSSAAYGGQSTLQTAAAQRGDSRSQGQAAGAAGGLADGGPHAPGIGPLTPSQAAQGVLWAEILGPPRAKRPYKRG